MRVLIGGLMAAVAVFAVTACSADEPAAPAGPVDMRSLGYDDREATYFDKASITRSGDIARITGVSVYRPDGDIQDGVYRADVAYEIDCAAPRGSVSSVREFDQAGALKKTTRLRAKWLPIPEGVMGHYMREAACTPAAAAKKRKVIDIAADARLTFAYLSPSTPRPPQIRRVGRSRASAEYFDAATIERTGDVTRVKVITVYNRAVGGPDNGAVVSVITEDFDCARGRATFVAAAEYDAAGKAITEGVYTGQEWSDLVPGSIGDDFKAAVCSPAAVAKRPLVQDYRADAAAGFSGER